MKIQPEITEIQNEISASSSCSNLPVPSTTLSLAFALIWLASMSQGFGAEPAAAATPPALPGTAINYVLMTNVVVVTNYVITTKVVVTTNAVAVGRTNAALPDLSWVPPADSFDWIQLKSGE